MPKAIQNITSSSKPEQSRRTILAAGASAVLAGAMAIDPAIPEARRRWIASEPPDLAFAAIAEKRSADAAHLEAIRHTDSFSVYDRSEAAMAAWDAQAAVCHYATEIDWKLARTVPTTLAGVAAVLRLANEIEDQGDEWPATDDIGPDGWHYQLRATMAQAIENLISAGKAVRS
jgi:hypothetical protein